MNNNIELGHSSESDNPLTNVNIYTPEAIRKFTGREKVFAFAALVLGYMFIKLFAAPFTSKGGVMGFGAAGVMLLIIFYSVFFSGKKRRLTKGKVLRVALCIIFSVNVAVNSNIIIQLLDAAFVVMTLCFDKLTDSGSIDGSIGKMFPVHIMRSVFSAPVYKMNGGLTESVKQSFKGSNVGKAMKNILLGLIIALPSTIVICILLMSADNGFMNIMKSIFNNAFREIIVFLLQLVLGFPIASYIFGMCIEDNCGSDSDERFMQGVKGIRFVPAAAGAVSAIPVCVLYLLFFFSQLSYFLSPFIALLPSGMSYAEYARRGFFELCAVSVINLCIIIALNLFCKYADNGKRPPCLTVTSCVLSVFTLLLIATAVSKMAMYINAYGLTPLRIYTTWFMLLLAIIFMGIFLSLLTPKVSLPKMSVTAFIIMFSALSLLNVDGIIAGVNAQRFLNGSLSSFDVNCMDDLSSGAVPAVCSMRGKLDSEEENAALEKSLSRYMDRLKEKDPRGITVSDIAAQSVYNSYGNN